MKYMIKDSIKKVIAYFKTLKFDTNHFGLKMAIVETIANISEKEISLFIKQVEQLSLKHKVKHLTLKLYKPNYHLLKSLTKEGFYFADINNIYRIYFDKINLLNNPNYHYEKMVFASKKYTPHLIKLSENLFVNTRFCNDKNLSLDKSNELYTLWIKNLTNNKHTKIILEKRNNKLAGYVTITQTDNKGYIIYLIGVNPEFRGKGIGKSLIRTAINYSKNMHASYLEVGTQFDNLAANNLYISYGFKMSSTIVTLHKYYNSDKSN